MLKEQIRVRDWMTKFGQETHNNNPTIPSFEIRKLRARLILEEALETCKALGVDVYTMYSTGIIESSFKPNLVEIADGIADSLVVQLGTAVACGIDIEPIFEAVMKSNDSKLWFEEEVANGTEYEGEDSSFLENDRHYEFIGEVFNMEERQWLVKDKNGKVIKSPSYNPPDIKF